MSYSRYSAGHTVLHASAFVWPALPLFLLRPLYPETMEYRLNLAEIVALWIAGVVVNFLLIAVHEAGHAVAGWAVGIRISAINIGHWRLLWKTKLGSIDLTVRAAPDSGYVMPSASRHLYSVPREFVFTVAGIVAEAILVALAWQYPFYFEADLTFVGVLEAFVLSSIICIGALHVVYNLYPSVGIAGGKAVPNDGMQVLQLWTERKERRQRRARFPLYDEMNRRWDAGDRAGAWAIVEELSRKEPDDIYLKIVQMRHHADLGDTAKAEQLGRSLLNHSNVAAYRVEILDLLCDLALFRDRRDLLREAVTWCEQALRHEPHAITLKGTRGSLLVELGQAYEGVRLLREVIEKSECSVDRTISLAYLAKVALAESQLAKAEDLLEQARTTGVDHVIVQRVAGELEQAIRAAASRAPPPSPSG